MVEMNLISDILEIVIAIPFICYYIYIMALTRKWKELEFNRMWRTRLFLALSAFLYTLIYAVANVRMLTKLYGKKVGSPVCAAYGCAHSGLFLSIFIIIVTILIKLATSVAALDSGTPNSPIIKKAVLISLITVIITAAIVIVDIFKLDLPVFESYNESENTCFNSTLQSTVIFILVLVCFIITVRIRDDSDYLGLNRNHKRIVGRFSLTYIAFFVASLVSEVSPWIGGWARVVTQLLTSVLNQVSFIICLNFLVQKPINDAKEIPLYRGTITKRHNKYNDSHEVQLLDAESA
ncbi:hypothetical protein TVAG_038540 [Trichomonas vaginalis G3]|uniref:G-protein coupled receptors family 1 profile domain-containing protein n=1 Tax=Trichomonas vaginalis (strain ATCC PRA-98 / G3) TaxID=412133 RepID=A2DY10_TRIV3|nr:hypothetical protein TVAGG3_0960700 [Trichomonas vaginalis G3]EAY14746.1 hypothetical protein TVAG_038540 [Trichomonas vaginalis G3]KAI5487883.1 hypothetical protein TVAGG3_0960700 [Trichomonas vaginalis G3]|eukprot:XP_001326969.1 hypothetical protein [Trichomonas vaginalis G3]